MSQRSMDSICGPLHYTRWKTTVTRIRVEFDNFKNDLAELKDGEAFRSTSAKVFCTDKIHGTICLVMERSKRACRPSNIGRYLSIDLAGMKGVDCIVSLEPISPPELKRSIQAITSQPTEWYDQIFYTYSTFSYWEKLEIVGDVTVVLNAPDRTPAAAPRALARCLLGRKSLEKHADLALVCEEGHAVPCLKMVLAGRSAVFAKMLETKDCKEVKEGRVTMKTFDSASLKAFWKFLVTDDLEGSIANYELEKDDDEEEEKGEEEGGNTTEKSVAAKNEDKTTEGDEIEQPVKIGLNMLSLANM